MLHLWSHPTQKVVRRVTPRSAKGITTDVTLSHSQTHITCRFSCEEKSLITAISIECVGQWWLCSCLITDLEFRVYCTTLLVLAWVWILMLPRGNYTMLYPSSCNVQVPVSAPSITTKPSEKNNKGIFSLEIWHNQNKASIYHLVTSMESKEDLIVLRCVV